MTEKMENPASLAASGAPNSDLAGASINSDHTVIRFTKQALRTTDAAIGQIAAMKNRVRDYEHSVGELRALLSAMLDLGETIGAGLDAIAAEQGIDLDQTIPVEVGEEDVSSDEPERRATYGYGLLGSLSTFRNDAEAE